jgi:ubiquinone/menaquinone biosynthesis C-methylase UbiE
MADMEDFWQGKHKESNAYWLTGSDLRKVFTAHSIQEPYDMDVMEIGVGKGIMTREMAADNRVIAVDISKVALKNVESVTEGQYVTSDMANIPDNSIDLAICHLVFQHCQEEMVRFIIRQTVRILSPTGKFSFQTAFCEKPNGMHKQLTDKGFLVWRDLETMKRIVEEEGGHINWVGGRKEWPQYNDIVWDIIQVTKVRFENENRPLQEPD